MIYDLAFRKKDNTIRQMRFLRLNELTIEDRKRFGVPMPTEGGPVRKYAEGQELVWDVEASEFKVFNWNTQVK